MLLYLEPAKLAAIRHDQGPMLIIAGPGSGKTRTLVERIVYLTTERQVEPTQIMVATFTEKAANELITRISNRMLELGQSINLHEMYIGTLHSIFLRFLEEHREYTRLKRNFRLMDQFDQTYLVYQKLSEFDQVDDIELVWGSTRSGWKRSIELIKQLNKVSEEVLDAQKLAQSNFPAVAALGHAYEVYQNLLEEENALDFSTIQTEALRLLEEYPAVLTKLQDQLRYVMVDEYQDTNTVQEKILLQLVGEAANLSVVGDDDQGLYRFRGATIRNILEFPRNFAPGQCKVVRLETNYRSHPGIIEFYNRWMEIEDWQEGDTTFRYEKQIQPREEEFPSYQSVIRISEEDVETWGAEIVAFIRKLEESGTLTDYNQIAFLFGSVKNNRVIRLAEILEENSIPVFSPRSALFFDREEVRLVVGAIVLCFPDLFEALGYNEDDIPETWEYYEGCAKQLISEVQADPEAHRSLRQWISLRAKQHTNLTQNTDYAFSGLMYELLRFPLFSRYLGINLNDQVNQLRAAYNLALLSKLLTKFEYLQGLNILTPKNRGYALRGLFRRFLKFLRDGGIAEYEDFDQYAPSGCVSFLTIHQSKGLEFPIVMVGSLHSAPRKQYTELDELLQQHYYHKPSFEPLERTKHYDFRRLYYTAFSRPQNLLVLTDREKTGHGRTPSKHFAPVWADLPNWQDWLPQLHALELETVKPVHLKQEYAFTSDILLYENCPLQYKYFRALEFAPVREAATMFGTLVHQTIEDIHKTALRGEAKRLTPEQVETWYEVNYYALSKSNNQYLDRVRLAAGLDHVQRYLTKHQGQWDRVIEAEVDVSLVKEDFILKGTIDLVRGEAGTVELVDFKSERKPDVNDPEARERLRRYQRQLEVYAHLVEQRSGHQVSKLHLYYTGEKNGSPYVSFDRSEAKIEQTIASFERVVRRIEQHDYDLGPIQKCRQLCENCDMRYHCNPHYPEFS